MIKNYKKRGESLIEIIMAFAIFAVILPPILYAMGSVGTTEPRRDLYFNGTLAIEDAKNIIHQMKNSDWNTIAVDGTYQLNQSLGVWTLASIATGNPGAIVMPGIQRSIIIEAANRDNTTRNIVSTGGSPDATTRKVTIKITYANNTTQQTSLYVSRYDNIRSFALTETGDFRANTSAFSGTVAQTTSGADGEVTIIQDPPPKPTTNLVSWWKFNGGEIIDGGNKTERDYANPAKLNARLYGNFTVVPNARYGTSMVFDGTNAVPKYLKVARTPPAGPGITPDSDICDLNSCTLEFTVKKSSGSSGSIIAWQDKVEYPANIIKGVYLDVGTTGSITTDVVPHTNSPGNPHTSNGALASSVYEHIAIVINGSSGTTHYVNGEPKSTGGSSSNNDGEDRDIYIGAKYTDTTTMSFLSGEIDDGSVYKTALDAATVYALARPSYTTPVKDLTSTKQIFGVTANVYKPNGTNVRFQVATSNSSTCGSSPPTTFVGPGGTSGISDMFHADTAFSATPADIVSVRGRLPAAIATARCIVVKFYFLSSNSFAPANNPSIKDVKIIYAN